MGFVLAEAAYRHGEPWRQELLQCLTQNRDDAFKGGISHAFPCPILHRQLSSG